MPQTGTPIEDQAEPLIKVAAKSAVESVASVIAQVTATGKTAHVRAIGAGAVNQAVKAVAIAGQFAAQRNGVLNCHIAFETLDIRGEQASAIGIRVNEV